MTKRIGLLIPSSNTVMEVDFYRNLPVSISVHTGRMYMEATTVEGEEEMLDSHTLPTARVLATAKPDVVVFGCTSAGALRGNQYDAQLCQRIADVAGCRVISVIESVRRELKASGAKTVVIVTPYVDALNDKIKVSVEADGIKVIAIHGMGISVNFDLARPDSRQIVTFVRERLGSTIAADALFVSCTNFRALSALKTLRELFHVPVITSNQAALSAVWRELRVEPQSLGLTDD